MLDLDRHRICLEEPERCTDLSAWHGHEPLAFYLVSALRPRRIVELGVHAGDSYCAFAQAVDRLGLDAECHGIDHWQGDEHAGSYGPEVLQELRAYHDERYSRFSTLQEMTFDEGVGLFDDGSIDLLHIDGCHSYEDVRHDVDAWWPKLRDGGVLLLHDTQERGPGWGVGRVFEELAAEHAHFGFLHSHGLGLVLKGPAAGHPLQAWWEAGAEDAAAIRTLFAALGARLAAANAGGGRDAMQEQIDDLRWHHDEAVAGRDAAIETLDTTKRERDAAVDQRNRTAARLEQAQRALDDAEARASWFERDARRAHEALQATQHTLRSIEASISWRAVQPLRRLVRPTSSGRRFAHRARRAIEILREEGLPGLGRRLQWRLRPSQPGGIPVHDYPAWAQAHAASEAELAMQVDEQELWSHRPLISFITPVWNCPPELLQQTIASVQAQSYSHWELCLVDGGSEDDAVRACIEHAAAGDARIRYRFLPENRGISGNSNEALAMARGEFIAILDHDDLIEPDALYCAVARLQDEPELDLIYWDEDKLEADGTGRSDPWCKPDWSPELLLSVNYLMHSILRRSLVDEVGGFDPATDGTQDWDLVLRMAERTDRIAHIPRILYHWRRTSGSAAAQLDAKPWANARQADVLARHLERSGRTGVRVVPDGRGRHRMRFLHGRPRVSIIIPTKDRVDVLRPCLDSIFERTTYGDFEVVLVDTGTTQYDALAYQREMQQQHPELRVVRDDRPFNYSAANNIGVRNADGDVLVFLNNDIEVQSPDWLDELVQWTQVPQIGCVGAKLVYPDGRIQHAGIIMGMHGHASHVFMGHHDTDDGPFGSVNWYRDYMAVTGACIAMRRDVFDEVGGFDEAYRLVFSDVQLGHDVHGAGYRNLYTPYCTLIHHESASRGAWLPAEDVRLAYERFRELVAAGDPYFNPNLSQESTVPALRREGEALPLDRLLQVCRDVGAPIDEIGAVVTEA